VFPALFTEVLFKNHVLLLSFIKQILSSEDFERLAELREREELRPSKKRFRGQSDSVVQPGASLEESDIVGYVKRVKLTKSERLASVMEGREDRPKFSTPKVKGGGSTDQDKLKNKPHMMIKHKLSVKGKQFKALTVKQRAEQGNKGRKKQFGGKMGKGTKGKQKGKKR
jgi:protein SDA1